MCIYRFAFNVALTVAFILVSVRHTYTGFFPKSLDRNCHIVINCPLEICNGSIFVVNVLYNK